MMEMPFDERLYAEMAAFFSEKMASNALLIGMGAAWQSRFQQDFANCTFAAAAWEEALPVAWHGRFSWIVLAPGVEELSAPESLLESLQDFLAPCAALVAPFRNPWHWSVFRAWLAGDLRYGANPLLDGQGRLFSFPELVRLAKLAHYEDFAVRQVIEKGTAEMLEVMQACGVQNGHQEMETSWWVVRLSVLDARTARLKARYTDAERCLLARLLHRLENGIEAAETVEALRRLLAESRIDGGYLEEFVLNTAGDADSMCDILRKEGLLR